jgi:hypothetical protein
MSERRPSTPVNIGAGYSRAEPVALVSACQNAASAGQSFRQAARRGRCSGDKADRARDIAAIMVRTYRDKAQRLYDELGEALAPNAKRKAKGQRHDLHLASPWAI